MTQAEIRTSVRGLVGDPAYDGALIDEAANWFVYELFNNTRTHLMEESDELTASAGDTTVDWPSDFMTLLHFYLTVPQVIDLKSAFMEYETFMRSYANFASAGIQQVTNVTIFGSGLRFSAPLNVDHTFQLDYLREPTPMTEDSSTCEVPDRYAELVSKGTLARVMEINEDYDEADNERSNLQPLLTTFIRNEGRGGNKVGPAAVIRTNRRRIGGNILEDGLRG